MIEKVLQILDIHCIGQIFEYCNIRNGMFIKMHLEIIYQYNDGRNFIKSKDRHKIYINHKTNFLLHRKFTYKKRL